MPDIDMQTADTFVVSYWSRAGVTREVTWGFEPFGDLNEAVDFYGQLERQRAFPTLHVGSLIAFRNGQPIGVIPTSRVGSMVIEGAVSARADREHARLASANGRAA